MFHLCSFMLHVGFMHVPLMFQYVPFCFIYVPRTQAPGPGPLLVGLVALVGRARWVGREGAAARVPGPRAWALGT